MISIRSVLWIVIAGCYVQALSPAPNVWKVFSDLAKQTESVDLGLGFPDWSPPQFVLESLHGATSHQYTRSAGKPELVQLLAETYGRHIGRYIDPMSEVAVTVGASQALYLALTTILKPDDEIIIFEPFFELYSKQIALTGATPVYVRLGGEAASPADPWALDVEQLKRFLHAKVVRIASLSCFVCFFFFKGCQ
jgi:kynurenine--oxoglutarate transaminase/cysteine-S-conjugate beta-lyase/glutamine--phenylpyruvate transaminase